MLNRQIKLILLIILGLILIGFVIDYFIDFKVSRGVSYYGVIKDINYPDIIINLPGNELLKAKLDENTKIYLVIEVFDTTKGLAERVIAEKEGKIEDLKVGDSVYFMPNGNIDGIPLFGSLIARSGILGVTSRFISNLYDGDKGEFKAALDSQFTDLENTYYGLWLYRTYQEHDIELVKNIDIKEIFQKIRSYYVSSGYYSEKNEEPIFSTNRALAIDTWFAESLDQKINPDWLKANSLENKNLDQKKTDPEYQFAVISIYRSLGMVDKLKEISTLYSRYYCDEFDMPKTVSDEDYLRGKYFQTMIVAGLSGAATISKSCLWNNNVEVNSERLNKIQLNQLDNLALIGQLYYLKNFYNLAPDIAGIFNRTKLFYKQEGFKENLNNINPNMTGTFNGVTLIQRYVTERLLKTF